MMTLFYVVESIFSISLFFQLLYPHFVVVEFVVVRITIFEDYMGYFVLMQGGSKERANLFGMKSFGGPFFFSVTLDFSFPLGSSCNLMLEK